MKILKKIKSTEDKTIKFIIKLDDEKIIELSYIDKDDGKDIICVPCQTGCTLGCKFCYLTKIKDKIITRNLTDEEIEDSIYLVHNDLKLEDNDRKLLISYMGSGEPILNYKNVVHSMNLLNKRYDNIRFALATSLPRFNWLNFYKMTEMIQHNDLDVKLHFSLHYTSDIVRNKWMPNSLNISSSLLAIDFYKDITGNDVEIHYALIKDLNDTDDDIIQLQKFFEYKNINVKFLHFNRDDESEYESTTEEYYKDKIENRLRDYCISSEFYTPPGLSIGGSCGQFLLEHYLTYNHK